MPKISFLKAYVFISLFALCVSCRTEPKEKELTGIQNLEILYTNYLTRCHQNLDSIQLCSNTDSIQKYYLEARKYFKMAEPVLAFMDTENYKFLNQPNITKVDEEDRTDIKIKSPKGFQVLEENIFADTLNVDETHKVAKITSERIAIIKKNTSLGFVKDYHFLWMFRDAITRVALTGITGFDSPVLENSLEEASFVYMALKQYSEGFRSNFDDKKLFRELSNELDASIENLKGDFNDFDRYHFIKNCTHPILKTWTNVVADWKIEFPFERAIKNNAASLFSGSTFNLSYFSSESFDSLQPEKVALGKQLFYEKRFSKNNTMSCATCHQPEKQFTDGLKTALGNTRNSPTLFYAALQKGFFYDNRAGSLEGQIVAVVNNKNEFHTNLEYIRKVASENEQYVSAFKGIYKKDAISDADIRNAIATYIRSLTPFNSQFDRNINGLETTLTPNEINGFNVFMGKGKCATCHFPPVFNGTVPVSFKDTEVELIGVPDKKDTINAIISNDLGRFHVFNTKERKHFFKTSTIRNIALTAPYMHNGVYDSLEEVIDFYNRGGGAGIGINEENQTLPTDPLDLTENEKANLISFMKTLSDPIQD